MRIIAARGHYPNGEIMTMIAKWVFPWNAKKVVKKMDEALNVWALGGKKKSEDSHQSSPS